MWNTHEEMVKDLLKDPEDIMNSLTASKVNLLHTVLGVSGEAGELLDAIKKHVIHGKPLDIWHVVEELGDLEFYLAGLRQSLNVSKELILKHNLDKLSERYTKGAYSDVEAIARADKNDKNDKED